MARSRTICALARRPFTVACASALTLAVFAAPAEAATITVDSTADNLTADAACTLREALTSANTDNAGSSGCAQGSGADTIVFAAATNGVPFVLSLPGSEDDNANGDLDIKAPVTIDGNGRASTIIDANNAFGIFDSFTGSPTPVTIQDMTLREGTANATGGGAIWVGSGRDFTIDNVEFANNTSTTGGGALVNNNGTVSITNSFFHGNSSSAEAGAIRSTGGLTVTSTTLSSNTAPRAGAIMTLTGSAVTTEIIRSTFSGNETTGAISATNDGGGAIYARTDGTLNLRSSTFDANASALNGGAVQFEDSNVQAAVAVLNITDTTITDNSAVTGNGGGVHVISGTANVNRSVIGTNTDSSTADERPDVSGAFVGGTTNLIGSADGSTGFPAGPRVGTNAIRINPQLNALANNGGLTLTRLPQTGSPVIDNAGASGCESPDQRGTTRPKGGACDIGSVELESDTEPPNTTIDGFPPNPTNSTSATFFFSGTDNIGVTGFECKLDTAATFTPCTSGIGYTGLTSTSHTFQVRATDAAGNVDLSPAQYTWTIDTTAPGATINSGPPPFEDSTAATFGFTGSDGAGGSGILRLECQLDSNPYETCTSDKTYDSLPQGSHTFRVRAVDNAGNTGSPAERSWVVDTVAPSASFTSTPSDPSTAADATFAFSGTDTGGSGVDRYECSLDLGAYEDCTSSKTYSAVTDGQHTARVRAVDKAGNTQSPAAEYSWFNDSHAPVTTIGSTPPNPSNQNSASVAFTAADAAGGTGVARSECQLDGTGWSTCTSPVSRSALTDASHTLEIRSIDVAGNVESPAAGYTWVVDTGAPDTTITAQPSDPSLSADASFEFDGSDPGGTGIDKFECSIDGGGYADCTSPAAYPGLADGAHTFSVRSVDEAGNADGSADTYAWDVDATAPTTALTGTPDAATTSTTASFTFGGSDGTGSGVDKFECSVDGGAFATCASPLDVTGLAVGAHSFRVRAVDKVGTADATPASFDWTVTAPAAGPGPGGGSTPPPSTPGGGGETPVPPAVATRVGISHLQLRLRSNRVAVKVRCRAAAGSRCTGKLTLKPTSKSSRRDRVALARAGEATIDVAAGQTKTLRIEPTSRLLALLRKRGKVIAQVRVKLDGSAAQTFDRLITVLPAKR